MSGLNLTEKESVAADKLRERADDILTEEQRMSSAFLLRWLRARDLDVEKAETMLRKSVEWRSKTDMDNILKWEAPEVLRLYYPAGLVGFDKEGCPILVVPFGRCDIRGLMETSGKENFIRYTYQILEQCMFRMKCQQAIHEKEPSQMVVVFDMEGLSLRHLTYKATVDVVLEIVRQYEANYPEILKSAYAVNAPKIFAILFGMIKPMLTMHTLGKIQIFGYDHQKWKKTLTDVIPDNQLPKHWGGTKEGNDEFCSSVVCMGGTVPAKYIRNGSGNNSVPNETQENEDLITVTVGAGKTLTMEYDILYSNSTIKWTWKTDAYDIGFSLKCEESEIIPYKRSETHKLLEQGSVVCDRAGRYTLTFDNSYSRLRAKTLHYFVVIISPDGILIEDEDNQTSL